MHTSLSTNTTLLRTAVVVLLGRERESVVTPFIGNHQVRSLQASSDDISAAYLGEFRNSIFFAAQSFPEHGINACWDESCDHTSAASTCRIEAAFACSLRYFPPQTGVDWFVFTTGSVFWNTEGLIAEVTNPLARCRNPTFFVLLLSSPASKLLSLHADTLVAQRSSVPSSSCFQGTLLETSFWSAAVGFSYLTSS